MPGDGIFLRSADGLAVLKQSAYDSEAILQTALAHHPEVLAGPTTTGDDDGRLLLIRREMGVPGVQDGAGTFSLDHLFVDSEGSRCSWRSSAPPTPASAARSSARCSTMQRTP